MQQRVLGDYEKLGAAGGALNRREAERTWTEELLVEHVHFCALGEKVARAKRSETPSARSGHNAAPVQEMREMNQ
jgi:hypothetical protein